MVGFRAWVFEVWALGGRGHLQDVGGQAGSNAKKSQLLPDSQTLRYTSTSVEFWVKVPGLAGMFCFRINFMPNAMP